MGPHGCYKGGWSLVKPVLSICKGSPLIILCFTWNKRSLLMLDTHLHVSRPLRSHQNPQTLPGSLSISGESLLSQNSPCLPTSLHVCLSIFYFLTIPHNLCSLFFWTHNTVLFPGSAEGNGCIYPTDHVMLWSRCFMGKALTGALLRVKEG